jgi:glycosyltransferase involved in cell wall biosynthesis
MAPPSSRVGRTLRIGLYSPYFGATFGGGEKYLAGCARALRDAFPRHLVELIGPVPPDRDRYARILNVDLSGIDLAATNRRVTPAHRWLNRVTALRPLRNYALGLQASRLTSGYDLFVGMAYAIPVRCAAPRGVVLCQFPYQLRSWQELAGYQQIVVQSDYVRSWVRRRWERDAAVVYPPVDAPTAEPDWAAKRRIILSVGRFIGHGHSKRQDLMIESFRRLLAKGLEGWELHLAGSVHRDAMHAGYFERVQELAHGLPVTLHPDAPYTEVQALYRQASLYWHAAGYGVDGDRDPAALEHFGMTTAEAMAHGVVPVAIGRGGQLEVVHSGYDGYLWQEPGQLEAITLQLADQPGLRRRLGEAARETSRSFSPERFAARIVETFGSVVQELEDLRTRAPDLSG